MRQVLGYSMLFFIAAGGGCNAFLSYFVDQSKVQQESDRKLWFFRKTGKRPRRLLTPKGKRLWLIRNILWGGALVSFVWF